MVKMRVRQNHRINRARRNRRVLPVALTPFLLSLEKSAVNQNAKSARIIRIVRSADEVFRTCHNASGAKKLNVCQEWLLSRHESNSLIAKNCVIEQSGNFVI